jgi:hypothetical protein
MDNRVPPVNDGTKFQCTCCGENKRRSLYWIRAKSASKLVVQIKVEILMLVPQTADGFRAIFVPLRPLDKSEGVSFHTRSVPENRYVRLLLKHLRNTMHKDQIQKHMAALHINGQAAMQLRSNRRDQDHEKNRLLTQGPDLRKYIL